MPKTPKLTLVHGFTPPEDVAALAKEKIASSGLTLSHAKQLGLSWLTADETRKEDPTAWHLPSLKIPYFEPDGSGLPMRALPNWPPFFRLRALRQPSPAPADFKKYLQPPNTGVCAYFPRVIDWPGVLNDPSYRLIITEGELKAAKACVEGFPTIGLGGVYSFRSSTKLGIDFLPSLQRIVWPTREVFIIYDSDLASNENVCRALNELGEVLRDLGALPKMLILPHAPDAAVPKVGLDDYLMMHGPETLENELAANGIHISFARPLHHLNEKYCYVRGLDRVVVRGTTQLASPQSLQNLETVIFNEQVIKDGRLTTRRVAAAKHWLTWPLRTEARALTYVPGMDPLDLIPADRGETPGHDYNTWPGWGLSPQSRDAAPFQELVDHLFTGDLVSKKWFLQWCAYPIQHPGTKLFTSVLFHGLQQGTGKSLIGYTLGLIYGKNFTEISQADLHGGFNEWAVGKQLIMGDDVTGSDKRQDLDLLKKMITQKEIRINAKFQPSYAVPDTINYFWTSNHADAFFLEDNDRRFFIHEITVPPLEDRFYRLYNQWLIDGGASGVFRYLLDLDLTGFNPSARALETSSKRQMTFATRSDLGNWVRDLMASPDEHLIVAGMPLSGDLFTNSQIRSCYAAYAGLDLEKVPAKRVAAELARAGVRQIHEGLVIRVNDRADRYYAIRHPEKWLKASLADIQRHLSVGDVLSRTEATAPAPRKRKY